MPALSPRCPVAMRRWHPESSRNAARLPSGTSVQPGRNPPSALISSSVSTYVLLACTLRATRMPLTTNSRCRSPKGRPPPRCIAPFAMSSTKPCGDLYGNSDVLRARRPRPTHTDRTFESAVYLRHICGQSEPILTAKPARALKVRPGLWPNTRAFRKGPCSPRLPPLCSAASARSALSGSNPSFSAVKSLPRRAAQPSTLARHKKIHLKKKEFSF